MRIAVLSDIHGDLAALARKNNRPKWEHILRFGYVAATGQPDSD
jgi:hypothetical protein